jgi:AraC-like DNA-binding protein
MHRFATELVEPVALKAAFDAVLEADVDGGERPLRPQAPQVSRCVKQLLDAIHSEPFDPLISVQQLKLQCGLLDNNVSSRFRREVGQSIRSYIDTIRLKTARRLLSENRWTVFEVCQAVGYYHPQTFYRAFFKSFQCTPGRVRTSRE